MATLSSKIKELELLLRQKEEERINQIIQINELVEEQSKISQDIEIKLRNEVEQQKIEIKKLKQIAKSSGSKR